MKDFRQLKVWEKSHQLALSIYKAIKEFPEEERYGLTSQFPKDSHEKRHMDVEESKRIPASLLKALRADC
jgi:hypothetical protein